MEPGGEGPQRSSSARESILSAVTKAHSDADEDEDAPTAEEIEIYNRLHDQQRGLPVGVHDEAFSDPLDGSLRVERGAMHRHLRLECEDESMNFLKAIREVSLEMREGIASGFGLDIIEVGTGGAGTSSVARTLVLDSGEVRAAIIRAFQWALAHGRRRMGGRRRSASRRCMSVGCVPCGGAVRRRRRRRPASAPAGDGHTPLVGGSAVPAPHTPREVPGMEEAKAYAKEKWDEAEPTQRPSVTRGLGRTKQARSDTRDSSKCAELLWTLLLDEDAAGSRPSVSSDGAAASAELFCQTAADTNAVTFEEFWQVLLDLLLVDQLRWDRDPDLRRLFEEGKLHRIPRPNWELFLVKAQQADRRQVEEEQRRVELLEQPDVSGAGANKSLTLVGLAKFFCSQSNSLVDLGSGSVSQDMTRPLSEYWIAASHHIYQDPRELSAAEVCSSMTPLAARHGLHDDNPETSPLLRALRAGCRCLCLALAQEVEEQNNCINKIIGGRDVQVLLQRGRVPFQDALGLISGHAFEENSWPVLLVLHLAALPSSLGAVVPKILEDCLGERLWAGREARLPSPQEASDKIVVVFAPDAPGKTGAASEQPGRLVAWRGRAFPDNEGLSRKTAAPGEGPEDSATTVGFLPSDGLARLERAKVAWLADHHSRHLSLVYPLAPRRAPSNFNLAAAWATGAQMAALVLGGQAEGAALVQAGRFAQENGGCGYVLKPECLLRPDSAEAPKSIELKLRVLGARAVPSSEGPLFAAGHVAAAVSVWGESSDCSRHVYKFTKPSGGRMSWPDAGEVGEDGCPKAMTFVISKPSTAVLCVELAELPSGPAGGPRSLGFFAASVLKIRPGVRWAPLWKPSSHGEAHAARYGPLTGLLVRVDVKEVERPRRTRFQIGPD